VKRSALTIEIDPAYAGTFVESGLRIAVAKSAPDSRPNAVWLAWRPSPSNTVVWRECYEVYAARVPSRAGERIVPVARHPAVGGASHPFLGSQFGAPVRAEHVYGRCFDVRNDAAMTAGFGLVQAAAINASHRAAPLNLVALPPGFSADFTSDAELHIWVACDVAGGTAVAVVPDDAIRIPLGERHARARYTYADIFTIVVKLSIENEGDDDGDASS
jgi:hypothetical protein